MGEKKGLDKGHVVNRRNLARPFLLNRNMGGNEFPRNGRLTVANVGYFHLMSAAHDSRQARNVNIRALRAAI